MSFLPARGSGYNAGAMHAAGSVAPVHQDIFKYLYDKGKGAAKREEVGQVLYNRGMINAALVVEAIRTAQGQVRQKADHRRAGAMGSREPELMIIACKEIGFDGLISPLKLSCADHEGGVEAAHPAVGRQELALRLRLDDAGPEASAPDRRAVRGDVRQGEEHHPARLLKGS